ncbi:MAG: PhzF family phenazine biosynthesis protein [Cyanobacteriota bacterium]|nr:PhzF family phenazine biosynthesis protein [Cyanobacteriota bacterium]
MSEGCATSLSAVLVQAFSDQPFSGNGAAVVRLPQPASAAWMQALAANLKQSETAYLVPWQDGWALRWFTPSCEVPLCGHATLAALVALGHWGHLEAGQPCRFHTRSGPLAVVLGREGAGGSLELPSGTLEPMAPPEALSLLLERRLGAEPQGYWRSGLGYRVALIADEAPLAAMGSLASELVGDERNGLVLMQSLPATTTRMVEARPADYQLRFFAPGLGIDEDPVTGSAHALVAPYWQQRCNKAAVVGWQCAPRGGGMLLEPASSGMIRLTGRGHLLWEGRLNAGLEEESHQAWRSWLNGA